MTKTILVLGGSRFHGFQIAESLAKAGNRVYVLNRGNFRFNYPENITLLKADRNNPEQLKQVLNNKEFDTVIDNNAYSPEQVKLLLDLIKDKCKHYIFTSTIAAHLTYFSKNPIKESDATEEIKGPIAPNLKEYSINKYNAEQEIKKYSQLNYTIFRLPNIFGEGDFLGKLSFFNKKIKNNEKIILEKENTKFSLIYVKDLVKIYTQAINNSQCYNKTINISDTKNYNYQSFFTKIYKEDFNKKNLLLMQAENLWKQEYFPLFPWWPPVNSDLQNTLFQIDFTPIETWAPKTLEWENQYFKNHNHRGENLKKSENKIIQQTLKPTQLIIKSSTSQLENKELKSNLGDLVRVTTLTNCLDNYLWLTDKKAINLLKWFIDPIKLITPEDLNFIDLSNLTDIYNIDNHIFNQDSFKKINSSNPTWHGGIYNNNQIIPENPTIASILKYPSINIGKSWQQILIEGMGFEWKQQDFAEPRINTTPTIDIGFNYDVHSSWTSKHWPDKNWKKLKEILSKKYKYSVSWQQGLNNFDEYVKWISNCKLILTPDTLGLHLASALRKKIIVLTGPTDNSEYHYNRITHLKPNQRECMPCMLPECKYKTESQKTCLEEITPEQVAEIIEKTLNQEN